MGVSSSKLDDDKALELCRHRKKHVRQALDGMYMLVAAHIGYIESLRNTGIALKKFAEPDVPVDSSLYTSTSATPEPLGLTEKSPSHFSYPSPSLSQHLELVESLSPAASSPFPPNVQVNHTKASKSYSTKVEERLPVLRMAASVSPLGTRQKESAETQPLEEAPQAQGMPSWDYFGFSDPISNHLSYQDIRRASNHKVGSGDEIQWLGEGYDIPDSDEEVEGDAFIGKEDFEAFDKSYNDVCKLTIRNSKPQNGRVHSGSPVTSRFQAIRSIDKRTDSLNGENDTMQDIEYDECRTPDVRALEHVQFGLRHHENSGIGKELVPQDKLLPKDFLSIMKEIEYLFIKAAESGNKIPRMLEASKVQLRPSFPETKAQRSNISGLFGGCLHCFEESEGVSQDQSGDAVKYLTWHRSTSSHSSSSRTPFTISKDNFEDSGDVIFDNFCMNSGSHTSTLNRLYAWERKLYDEVKASGIIRREYDMKCKLLRQQDSRGESHYIIDKTRAIVKDLHSRIRVAIHQINTISTKIEELRDKELHPQLQELVESLYAMWKVMFQCHQRQLNIITIANNNESSKMSMQSELHRQVAAQLENELNSLCSNFLKWIAAQKLYLSAIHEWLMKCVPPHPKKSTRGRQSSDYSPQDLGAPTVYVTCGTWLKGLNNLKEDEVASTIKGLVMLINLYLPRPEATHRKLPSLALSSAKWKSDKDNSYHAVHVDRNEPAVDWNSCFHGFHSALVEFFEKLSGYANLSEIMYRDLLDTIEKAQEKYNSGTTQ